MIKRVLCICLGFMFISMILANHGRCDSKKPIKMIVADMMPEIAASAQCIRWWGDAVEKRTQGKIKFQYYFGASLVGAYEQLAGVKDNVIQVTPYYSAYHPDIAPIPAMALLPLMLCESFDSGIKASDEWLRTNAEAQKEFKKNNVKYMNPLYSADAYMWSKFPLQSVTDFNGASVRAFGPWLALFDALGSSVISVPVPEIYNAMERGVVKSTLLYLTNGVGLNLFEVTEYLNTTNLGYHFGMPLVMNLDTWNNLPDDVKTVIEELNTSETIQNYIRIHEECYEREMKLVKEKGMKFTQFSQTDIEKMRAIAKEKVWYPYAKKMEDKGIDGNAVLEDLMRLVEKY